MAKKVIAASVLLILIGCFYLNAQEAAKQPGTELYIPQKREWLLMNLLSVHSHLAGAELVEAGFNITFRLDDTDPNTIVVQVVYDQKKADRARLNKRVEDTKAFVTGYAKSRWGWDWVKVKEETHAYPG